MFDFHGFSFGQLQEVTEEESLSQLKHKLLQRDAVLDVEKVRELADLLRIHFKDPQLQLGLTALDYPAEFRSSHQYRINFNLLAADFPDLVAAAPPESIYHRALLTRHPLLLEDLPALPPAQPAGSPIVAPRLPVHTAVALTQWGRTGHRPP
ncbi:MAG: hypothetical protein HC821_00035 [Lewinella sp.]|nr:hypothetical protein [Lewinella sp.]